ncbi:MAG: T9SS type A sorting domain-containing protein [bacterium]
MKRFALIPILVFFAFLAMSQEMAFAEGGIAWTEYYPQGVPISEAPETQRNIRMAPDGSGGAIIVWEDYRNAGVADIYAQKIDENGVPQWTPDGVPVCTNTNSQLNPVLVGDGYGGAIIAWQDDSGSIPNIYAVRISSAGNTHSSWPGNGQVLKFTPTDKQSSPEIVSNGSNGAIIVWQEDNGSQYSIYAHGIDGDGNDTWGGSTVVSTGTEPKEYPKIMNDGTGYVIVTWQDYRNNNNYDIYAQRIEINTGFKAAGWAVNGSSVTVANGNQLEPQIVPDGFGGAFITWTDCRNDNGDIYAQRIDSDGNPAADWTTNGVAIYEGINRQDKPVIINALSAGTTTGAIIAWEDERNYSDYGIDIYGIRISSYVTSFESGDEVLIAGGYRDQKSSRMVGNDEEGGIVAWLEDGTTKDQIFAQKTGKMGEKIWTSPSEVSVCEATEINEHCMISDSLDGVIIAWVARGDGGDYNIYAQRVIDNATQLPSASISGFVLRLLDGEGITGVEVEALKDDESVSSDTTLDGYYEIAGLERGPTYEVRATWTVNDIVSSVSMEATAPSSWLFFTLEIQYYLATIAGNVSGVEGKYVASLSSTKSKRISGSGLQKILSPGNGIAFVELEQRDKVIVRVPIESDGTYSIPNLLPGRFIARAYNGTIYSNPRTVNLKEGETLRVNFAFGVIPEEEVYNYPNPAKSGWTMIRYYCGYSDPEAQIKIYNIAGEVVRKVGDSEINKPYPSENIYEFSWNCKNSSGKEVASGIYIYIVEVKDKNGSGSKKVVKRLAVIR